MCYPSIYISDTSLSNANGSLSLWYENHPETLKTLCSSFQIPFIRPKRALIEELNDSIISKRAANFNEKKNTFNAVSFFIHGFRKSFKSIEKDVSSTREFEMLSPALNKNGMLSTFEVNVFWDGFYDCCFSSNFKKNKQLFKLFALASENAEKVSFSFRKLLLKIHFQHINILGHSLGARIGLSACLPEKSGAEKFTSTLNLCLLAPAIGSKLIEDRIKNTKLEDLENFSKHVRLLVVFNENDFVLLKKDNKIGFFGPGAKRYADTRLGCNFKQCAEKLQQTLLKLSVPIELKLIDHSNIGKCHSLRCYFNEDDLVEIAAFFNEN